MKEFSALRSLILIAGCLGAGSGATEPVDHNVTTSEPESVKLLYGESHGISWTDLSLGDRQHPLLTRMYLDVYSVDYHYRRNLIFFTGWGAIWRLPMDEAGGDVQGEQIVGGLAGAATLAVDWEHDRIYWTCPATGTVWRSDLEGGEEGRHVVIEHSGNLKRHNNVVVDPYMRYLFVATDSGYGLRSDLAGDNLVRLDHGLTLTSHALDIHNRRLYVSGYRGFAPVLQSSDYDGTRVIDYQLHHGNEYWVRLISIDVFSGAAGQQPQLFWVHHGWKERDTAWKVNVSDGQLSWQKEYTSRGTALEPENRIWCVRVCHPDVQRRPSSSSASSSILAGKCLQFQTLSYLVLAVICRQTFV